MVSYAVRHMDTTKAGSGEIYKFSEEELILTSTLNSLRKLIEKDYRKKAEKDDPYSREYSVGSVGQGITNTAVRGLWVDTKGIENDPTNRR